MCIFMEIKSSIYFDFLVAISLIPSSWDLIAQLSHEFIQMFLSNKLVKACPS